MKIEIPKEKLKFGGITIEPHTFAPLINIYVDQQYYDDVCKIYKVDSIHVDWTEINEYAKNNYFEGFEYEYVFKVDNLINVSNKHSEDKPSIIDRMYDEKYTGFRCPVVIDVIKLDILSVSDVTKVLAKRYKEILEPIKDIDLVNDKISNSNLLWMCNRIIEDETLPEDKISRWIGFIQGVMAVKGYIVVDEERDFSRPLFHQVYKNKNITIPETLEKGK